MGIRSIKRNFTGGEVAPTIRSRDDLAKYQSSCSVMENFVSQVHGGARFRGGTLFVGETDPGRGHLIPFQFNTEEEDMYVLVFTNNKLQFVQDEGYVVDGENRVTVDTPYLLNQIRKLTVGYAQTGDVMYLYHPLHAPRKLSRLSHTEWTLEIISSEISIDAPEEGWSQWSGSGGGSFVQWYRATALTVNGEESLASVIFGAADAKSPNAWESGDKITIYCDAVDGADEYNIYKESAGVYGLTALIKAILLNLRNSNYKWTASGSGTDEYYLEADAGGDPEIPLMRLKSGYQFFSIRNATYEWLLSGSGTAEYYLRKPSPPYDPGIDRPDIVYENSSSMDIGVLGSLAAKEWAWGNNDSLGYDTVYVRLTDATDPDTKAADYVEAEILGTSGVLEGIVKEDVTELMTSGDVGSLAAGEWDYDDNDTLGFSTIYVRLTDGTDPDSKAEGYIVAQSLPTIEDHNFLSDNTITPVLSINNPFENFNYPSVAAFHQQRLWVGGSNDNPNVFYASQTGDFENFNKSRPAKDDDSLEFSLYSNQINIINWITSFGDLLMGTAGAEFRVKGDEGGGAITPSSVDAQLQSAWGSASLRPVVIGNSVLHVQRQGSTVRDLFYSLEKDGYAGNDLSVLANHLFDGHTIVSWAYQQEPDSVIWAVRDDGVLLGLTYLKEHEIWGWHRHITDGTVKSVCVVGGEIEDRLYMMVDRNIDGATKYYIEKLQPKWKAKDGIENAFYVDCGLTYTGAETDTISGLGHLEGEEVIVLADGSPVNELLTVEEGSITIPVSANTIHVGLPYRGILAPLPFELTSEAGTSQGQERDIGEINIRLDQSVGGKVGSANIDTAIADVDLDPILYDAAELGNPVEPFTGLKEITSNGGVEDELSIYIVQDQPLPLNVLAVIAETDYGDEGDES